MSLTPKLLIVDDDLALARTLVRILKEQGYEAFTVSGHDALFEALAGDSYDVVLIDAPAMGPRGIDALERLRGDPRYRHLPVLLVSGLALDDLTARRLGFTGADFVAKPFRVHELLTRLRAQLRLGQERNKARFEQRSRSEMADILSEVGASLQAGEIYQILVRRVAQGLRIPRCSVILARPGDAAGIVVAAYEDPTLHNLPVDLRKYPEIRQCLESGESILVEDVATDPLYEQVRQEWAAEGRPVTARSAIVLRFSIRGVPSGVFFLRTTRDETPLSQLDLRFADQLIHAAVTALERAYEVEQAMRSGAGQAGLGEVDPLTSCVDRRTLIGRADREMDRTLREASTLACLVLDLDGFAKVNETWDTDFGDRVLKQVANLLRREQRAIDTVARLQEDSFAVLLPEQTTAEALAFAERLLRRITGHEFGESGRKVKLTASIGLSAWPDQRVANAEGLVGLAEKHLADAKRGGRNRVVA